MLQILFFHVGVQYKRDEGLVLISCHAYASPVYIHLPNIYRIVVCNNAEPRKKIFFQESKVKNYRVVSLFMMLTIDTLKPLSAKAVCKFTILLI